MTDKKLIDSRPFTQGVFACFRHFVIIIFGFGPTASAPFMESHIHSEQLTFFLGLFARLGKIARFGSFAANW